LLGIPGTGRSFRYDIAAFFTAHDGLLSEAWVLGDLDGLRRQLA
jgi:predicted ester cyclase